MTEKTITITVKEYEKLIADSIWLECLEGAGVDNWEGFGEAHALLDEFEEADGEDDVR